MARICLICGKSPQVGNLVSHARNRVKRWLFPNVHKMRFVKVSDPHQRVVRGCVCTKCMKAGKVKKVV